MVFNNVVIFRVDKVFPTIVTEFYHIAHHGSGYKRKCRIGTVNQFNVFKTIFKPVSIVRTAGVISIGLRQRKGRL